MKKIYWGMLAVSLLAGCSSVPTPMPEGRWQESQPSVGKTPISFEIKDGRISAYAGCNRMMGGVAMNGGQLDSGQLVTTLMLCHGDDQVREDALKNLLESKPRVDYDGKILVLKQGNKEYRFDPQPSLEGGKTRLIYVSAEKAPCTGVAPMECLQIRDEKSEPWTLHYGDIEGFNPEPGIAYRLRIKEFDVPNPPADGSDKRWVLDMIIEQEVVSPR